MNISSTRAESPHSETGPWAQEVLTLRLMLCWHHPEILNNFFNKGLAFSFCTEPKNAYSQFCREAFQNSGHGPALLRAPATGSVGRQGGGGLQGATLAQLRRDRKAPPAHEAQRGFCSERVFLLLFSLKLLLLRIWDKNEPMASECIKVMSFMPVNN